MNILSRTLKAWLPLAVLTVMMCGLVYLAVQQSLRMNANDPQIQLAEDAADALSRGVTPPAAVGTSTSVDMLTSLAPYVAVYDATGTEVASNAFAIDLSKNYRSAYIPALPPGILGAAQAKGENRITWEPMPGLRYAIVVLPVYDANTKTLLGYVMSGRSLHEVEKRESQALFESVTVGIVTLIALFLVELGIAFWDRRR